MKKLFFLSTLIILGAASYAQSAKELYNAANEKFDQMKFKEAIELYNKAIALDKNYTEAYYNRGIAKGNNKDGKGALADYSKAIEIDPKFAPAYNNRGLMKKSQLDYKGALLDYNNAIANDTLFAAAYLNRGSLHVIMGKKDDGCMDFKKALELGQQKAFESIVKFCQ
jgi:tetratricopeptide (TPR) repeat protein